MKSFSEFLIEMIRKREGKFVVLDSKGKKVLGTHKTKKKAQKQLAAIEISKKSLSEQINIPNRDFGGFYHPNTKQTIVMPYRGLQSQHGFFVFANPKSFGLTEQDVNSAAGEELHTENADEFAGVLQHLVHQQGWVRVHGQDSGRTDSNGSRLYDVFMSSTDKDSLQKAISDHSRAFGSTINSLTVDYHTPIDRFVGGDDIDWDKTQSIRIENRAQVPSAINDLFGLKK
jgi:hypothetical protein